MVRIDWWYANKKNKWKTDQYVSNKLKYQTYPGSFLSSIVFCFQMAILFTAVGMYTINTSGSMLKTPENQIKDITTKVNKTAMYTIVI